MIPGFKPHKKKQKEGPIDKKVREYGMSLGGETVKLSTFGMMGTVGYPDRIWLFPGGLVFFMEMKAPGKPCTERQLQAHIRLRALGFRVYVCDNIPAGRGIIDAEVKRKKRYLPQSFAPEAQ